MAGTAAPDLGELRHWQLAVEEGKRGPVLELGIAAVLPVRARDAEGV